jgi:protein tyrosine/serine phosphatase
MTTLLVPLRNFAELRPGTLFRSAQPLYPYEYAFLAQKLGVRALVNLRAEANLDAAHRERFTLLDVPVRDDEAPTDAQAAAFLAFLADPKTGPTLFHCEHGHGRTSTFAVLARLAEGWPLERALAEEAALGYTFHHPAQTDFLTAWAQKRQPHQPRGILPFDGPRPTR